MASDRHLEMRRNFSSLDDPFSMSLSPLKEKFLSVEDPNPPWFWKALDGRKISPRDLIRGAFQSLMKCKILQWVKGGGVIQREDAIILQNHPHLPCLSVWKGMMSERSFDPRYAPKICTCYFQINVQLRVRTGC